MRIVGILLLSAAVSLFVIAAATTSPVLRPICAGLAFMGVGLALVLGKEGRK